MAQAGIRPDLSLNSFGIEEQQIIRMLSRVWHVSFVKAGKMFKDVEYNYIFVKPTDTLVRNFNFEREILTIMSSFVNYDGRLMDFVDKTHTEFKNRLDKLCVILISKDKQIRDKMKQISIQDKESRIVIPFIYDELLYATNTSSLIEGRLKEYFHTRDLFAYDSPLKTEAYFFGRTKTLQDLYSKYRAGENGCLFGLRRIGKTSVLLALKRNLLLREEPAVYIDCSEPAFHKSRWNEVLWHIIENTVNSLNIKGIKRLPRESYDEKNASACFEKDLVEIKRRQNNKKLLIILDEIENITFSVSPSSHWTDEKDFIFLWQTIRSIFQKKADLFSVVVAGVNPVSVETAILHGHDNPIYRFITPYYLGFFDIKEIKEMVSSIGKYMGLSLDEEIFTYLMEDFGGHPFLTRRACSQLNSQISSERPYHISRYKYGELREMLGRHVQEYIEFILSILKQRYSVEYELLECLAQGDHETFTSFAKDSHLYIEHLDGYGLIKEVSGKYYFKIKTVEDYIKTRTKMTKKASPKEEKWTEISAKRNDIELRLRKMIKYVLKSKYMDKTKDKLLEVVPSNAREKYLDKNIDSVLEGLYFENLKMIILKNWADFATIFQGEKEKFTVFMDCVNKCRIDAHARDIDDDGWAALIIAIQWLSGKVKGYLD